MKGKGGRVTEKEKEPEVVGAPLVSNCAHTQTHTHTHTHTHAKPFKDTLSSKPEVILTPSEVLFWHISLRQRKDKKILWPLLSIPQV